MPHASAAQLATRLKRAIPADQAAQALDEASGVLDSYVGYPLAEALGYAQTFTVAGLGFLYLPRRYQAVSAVTVDGVALVGGTWAFDAPSRTLRPSAGSWARGSVVTVTGTSGFAMAAIPVVVRAVVLSVAGRVLENPIGGIRSEQLADHSITFSGDKGVPTGGVYLTEVEMGLLDDAGLRDWVLA